MIRKKEVSNFLLAVFFFGGGGGGGNMFWEQGYGVSVVFCNEFCHSTTPGEELAMPSLPEIEHRPYIPLAFAQEALARVSNNVA